MNEFDGLRNTGRMEVNGLVAEFHMPHALKSMFRGDEEIAQALPPRRMRSVFLVDKYPGCPKNWMRSTAAHADKKRGELKSYFVPVRESAGMWLDFNGNHRHTHHIAVLISIQGVNPVTGLACDDIRLEQYIDKCPKHKKAFGPDRFCAECNFKWPKQNYLASTGTPSAYFWLDGWRTADGIIRQYILTEERMRGVATHKVGEKRVYAIGISFFLSKEPRPAQVRPYTSGGSVHTWNYGGAGTGYLGSTKLEAFDIDQHGVVEDKGLISHISDVIDGDVYKDVCKSGPPSGLMSFACSTGEVKRGKPLEKLSSKKVISRLTANLMSPKATSASASSTSLPVTGQHVNAVRNINPAQARNVEPVTVKQLEVGAGAKIIQQVYDDPNSLDFWQDVEAGTIVINYASEVEAEAIIKAGVLNLEGHPEGMLQNVPVGN